MGRPKYPSDSQAQFMLRLPPGMRELIKRSAEEAGRSMNAEIIDVLREYFPADPDLREVVDAVDQSMSLLKTLIDEIDENGGAIPGSIPKVLAGIQSLNDQLYKLTSKDRISPVAMLSQSAMVKVEEIARIYDFQPVLIERLISSLVVMGAELVLSKEARLRVEIGEGDSSRIVEIDFPQDTPPSE